VFFHLPKFLLSLVFAYIYISQGSVMGYIIMTLLQIVCSVSVKEFWKFVNNRRRYWQK